MFAKLATKFQDFNSKCETQTKNVKFRHQAQISDSNI